MYFNCQTGRTVKRMCVCEELACCFSSATILIVPGRNSRHSWSLCVNALHLFWSFLRTAPAIHSPFCFTLRAISLFFLHQSEAAPHFSLAIRWWRHHCTHSNQFRIWTMWNWKVLKISKDLFFKQEEYLKGKIRGDKSIDTGLSDERCLHENESHFAIQTI